jgi:hypothetical protein
VQWQRDGTWAAVISQLQAAADASGLIAWDVSVDSTTQVSAVGCRGVRQNSPSATATIRLETINEWLPRHL